MEHVKGERKLQQLEEFLQDLFFQSKSEEELNLIVEILLEIRSSSARTATMKDQTAFSDDGVAPRSEIFRISVQGSARRINER